MRRTFVTTFVVAAAVTVVTTEGCSGRDVSLGEDGLTSADSAIASGQAEACPVGSAHPNICCQGSSCGEWKGQPFRQCPKDYDHRPRPDVCCSLDDPSKCGGADSGTFPNPHYDAGCGTTCQWACLKGYSSNGSNVCCKDGNPGECYSVAITDGGDSSPPCWRCPQGYDPLLGTDDVCCRRSGDSLQCFVHPHDPGYPDAGPWPIDAGHDGSYGYEGGPWPHDDAGWPTQDASPPQPIDAGAPWPTDAGWHD
jgi:hypothetical protein